MVQPSQLDAHAKLIAALPLKAGGLGLHSAVDTSEAAYLGALADAVRTAQTIFPDLTPGMRAHLQGSHPEAVELSDIVNAFNLLRHQQHVRMARADSSVSPLPAIAPPDPTNSGGRPQRSYQGTKASETSGHSRPTG